MNKITQAVIDLGGEWPSDPINNSSIKIGGVEISWQYFSHERCRLLRLWVTSGAAAEHEFSEWLKTYIEENWSEEDEQRMDIVGSNGPSGEHYGLKDDSKKPRYDLLPAAAIEDMAQVLTFGADKYGAENWRKVENATARYQAAMLRHAFAIQRGEGIDPETGISHAAHVMCCAAFICELQGE